MPLVNLKPLLVEAGTRRASLLGMVCLGWEDAAAFVAAGEATNTPVVLQAGPGARRAIPLAVWGAMFQALGTAARVPVVAHLDHGTSADECKAALDAGFTSVMYDGSRLPLAENIAETQKMVAHAEAYGASTEAEVGFVGYAEGAPSEGTDPGEALRFVEMTGVDCLAVSVGNVHLQTEASTPLDWAQLAAIRAGTAVPLVLHGGSGVPAPDRTKAAQHYGVRKINLGTEIRQAYGSSLRAVLAEDAAVYDRLAIGRAVADRRAALIETTLRSAWQAAD